MSIKVSNNFERVRFVGLCYGEYFVTNIFEPTAVFMCIPVVLFMEYEYNAVQIYPQITDKRNSVFKQFVDNYEVYRVKLLDIEIEP